MQDYVEQISLHINELVTLGNSLSFEENIFVLQESGGRFIREQFGGNYWRGADIQVVKCKPGSKEEDFLASLIDVHWMSSDEPCPSRYPTLMTGLINAIQEKAKYLDAGNKYEFYGEIARQARHLELSNYQLEKTTVCRSIIFNQIRLLCKWRNELIEELAQPNLLEKGWTIYFGYGRNANQKEMLNARRCPDAKYLGPAWVENFRFLLDEKGFASIEKSAGSIVYGLLWAVSPADMSRLDLREGVRIGSYRKEEVQVHSILRPFDETTPAMVYISNRMQGNVPAEGYIQQIFDGLISAGLSEEQLSYLSEFLTEKRDQVLQVEKLASNKITTNFLPTDLDLPFFAYGLFKSNQIAHERIKEYVEKVENTSIDGCFLAERDGIPLLGFRKQLSEAPKDFYAAELAVYGEKIFFKTDTSAQAYNAIADLEPENVYSWSTISIGGEKFNVLSGKKIFKGSQPIDHSSWDMLTHDPFIGDLEKMIERLMSDQDRKYEVLELQAAYMMLWTGIERLVTFRHSLKQHLEKQIVKYLSENETVITLFDPEIERPIVFRDLYSASKPSDRVIFDPKDVTKCIKYLRQIRHNVVHRGKGGYVDSALTEHAIGYARNIFQILAKY